MAQALAAEPLLKFRGPGLAAALIAAINMVFAWFFLKESHDAAAVKASGQLPRSHRNLVGLVSCHAPDLFHRCCKG